MQASVPVHQRGAVEATEKSFIPLYFPEGKRQEAAQDMGREGGASRAPETRKANPAHRVTMDATPTETGRARTTNTTDNAGA